MSVFFNGQLLISPVTASTVDDSAMRNQNLSVGNAVALLGASTGGTPKTALRFGSPQEAQRTLVSGELLDAVLAAFSPSTETNGPSQVIAVRVNPAIQSALTLKDSTAANVITLTSDDYGLATKQIAIKIDAGSLSGYRPTVKKGADYFTVDNLTRNAFTIQYSGAAVSAVMTIAAATVTLQAPSGTAVATLDLNQYATVTQLVDAINAVPSFTATVGDGNYGAAALNGLDFVTAQDVKTALYTAKANLQALVDWFNGPSQSLVTAVRVAGAGAPPAVSAFANLAGGTDGSTVNQDWVDSFTVLQTVECQWISPVSGSGTIRAMADAHVSFMSHVARKERRAIVGMDLSSTDVAAIAAAKSLNSDRTSLIHIGHYNYNAAGVLTLYPAYISAAMVAGAFAGVSPGTPLTNKAIRVQGLERNLRNPTDTDVLINGGVLCLESTDSGYKIVQSISTWLVNANYNKREQSCGVAMDYTIRSIRKALDVLRGQKNNPLILNRAQSITQSVLAALSVNEPVGPGVLAGNKDSPPFANIKATVSGDVLNVQFQASPVIPANYVLVTMFAVPFSGVSTSVVGA